MKTEELQMTAEDFERWLKLQELMGWTVRETSKESVRKIREAFRQGGTITVPARLTVSD